MAESKAIVAAQYRAVLAEKRESLRGMYARYMECGSRMRERGLVKWSKKSGAWYCEFLMERTYKERATIKLLMDLQRNISQQSMLLLELEHAIDREEAKKE
jgi:hypothetical protein